MKGALKLQETFVYLKPIKIHTIVLQKESLKQIYGQFHQAPWKLNITLTSSLQ